MAGEQLEVSGAETIYAGKWAYLRCPICGEINTNIDEGLVQRGPDRDEYDSAIGTRGGYVDFHLRCGMGHAFTLCVANHKGMEVLACVSEVDDAEPLGALCESPMESSFWSAYARQRPPQLAGLTPQVKVSDYRVDFGIEDRKLAIEIDGFEFHSTREQLANDRKRQRDLETLGWRICRFSGREVHRDASQCVVDAAAWASCQPN